MIELAYKLGRNDEALNIEAAQKLCESMDKNGIREIVGGLKSNDQAVANDCIKVLYEIGRRKPELITEFTNDFISALSSRNNRIVWGSMIALSFVASINPETMFNRLNEIIAAYKAGSVITVDNSISVFAGLCKANKDYEAQIFPLLINHLENCRAKEIPQHAERIAVCIDSLNKEMFINAIQARTGELSESQKASILRLIKQL